MRSMARVITDILAVECAGTFMHDNRRRELFTAEERDDGTLILAAEDRRGSTRYFELTLREVDEGGNPITSSES